MTVISSKVTLKPKYYCKIQLKGLPTGGNSRQHWRAKYQEIKKWKGAIFDALRASKGIPSKPLQKVKLRYTRCSSNSMDWDNLAISFKSVQDGLVEARVLHDDKIKNIPKMPVYRQVKAKRGEGRIIIELWEV